MNSAQLAEFIFNGSTLSAFQLENMQSASILYKILVVTIFLHLSCTVISAYKY